MSKKIQIGFIEQERETRNAQRKTQNAQPISFINITRIFVTPCFIANQRVMSKE